MILTQQLEAVQSGGYYHMDQYIFLPFFLISSILFLILIKHISDQSCFVSSLRAKTKSAGIEEQGWLERNFNERHSIV